MYQQEDKHRSITQNQTRKERVQLLKELAERRYLTTGEFARQKSITQEWARALARQGKLEGAVRIGAQWFIPAERLNDA